MSGWGSQTGTPDSSFFPAAAAADRWRSLQFQGSLRGPSSSERPTVARRVCAASHKAPKGPDRGAARRRSDLVPPGLNTMKCPPLAGALVVVVLVVATAAPPGRTQPDKAAGTKQVTVMKKPASSRKGMDQPARDSRPGRRRSGQPYFTGHRSVAFLRMGEIDVMSVSPLDPCLGCCGDGGNHIPITRNEGGGIARGASSNRNMKVDPDGTAVNSLGSNSYSTTDRCLGCCMDETGTPSPTPRKEGVTAMRPASIGKKETVNKAPVKSAQRQPSQQPREKVPRWRPAPASSSEEEEDYGYMAMRGGGVTQRSGAERAQPIYRASYLRNEASLCPRGGCQSEEDSFQSSSEEARASKHIRIWDLQPSPARRG